MSALRKVCADLRSSYTGGFGAVSGAKMILFHAADLIWATKIKGTAEALGLPARPVRSLEMLEARLADSPVKALIVDLDAPETALALITRVRPPDAPPQVRTIRVVAFGPHVAVDAMQAAKVAGADAVLARGGFSARMASILKELAAGSPVADVAEDTRDSP